MSSVTRLLRKTDDRAILTPTAMITEAAIIQVSTLTTGPRLDGVIASRLSISRHPGAERGRVKVEKKRAGSGGDPRLTKYTTLETSGGLGNLPKEKGSYGAGGTRLHLVWMLTLTDSGALD